jgi:hypothetical protein
LIFVCWKNNRVGRILIWSNSMRSDVCIDDWLYRLFPRVKRLITLPQSKFQSTFYSFLLLNFIDTFIIIWKRSKRNSLKYSEFMFLFSSILCVFHIAFLWFRKSGKHSRKWWMKSENQSKLRSKKRNRSNKHEQSKCQKWQLFLFIRFFSLSRFDDFRYSSCFK